MQLQLKCIVGLLLLLLAALSPVVVVATARRELPLMAAAIGDDQGPQRQGVSRSRIGTDAAPEGAATAEGGVDETVRRRKDGEAAKNSRRFRRTSRMPASPQFNFGGRIPFTADYHNVHRHPPSHN